MKKKLSLKIVSVAVAVMLAFSPLKAETGAVDVYDFHKVLSVTGYITLSALLTAILACTTGILGGMIEAVITGDSSAILTLGTGTTIGFTFGLVAGTLLCLGRFADIENRERSNK